MKGSVPLNWRLKRQRYGLVGSKCVGCSGLFFPSRRYCTNCRSEDIEEYHFVGFGTIESFTTIRVAPAGFSAPYVVALVRLDEGPLVAAQVVADWGDISIGKRVFAVFRKLHSSKDGGIINYGFKFQPI